MNFLILSNYTLRLRSELEEIIRYTTVVGLSDELPVII